MDQSLIPKLETLSMDQLLAVVRAYVDAAPFERDLSEF
jgi:hypothetical protein